MVPDGAPFFGAAEAAWQEVYQRDLVADLWGPDNLTRRRITALLDGLPSECALWRDIHNTRPFDYRYTDDLIRLLLASSENSRSALWLKLKDKFEPIQPNQVPWKRETKTVVGSGEAPEFTPALFARLAAGLGS